MHIGFTYDFSFTTTENENLVELRPTLPIANANSCGEIGQVNLHWTRIFNLTYLFQLEQQNVHWQHLLLSLLQPRIFHSHSCS